MNKNAVISGVIFVLSLIVFFVLIPQQVYEREGATMGPQFFPKMVTIVLAALSLLLFVQSIFIGNLSKRGSYKKFQIKPYYFSLFLLVLFSFLYIAAMGILGFLVSTVLFLSATLMLFGEKRFLVVGSISVVGSLTIFVVFGNFLNLLMPSGLFSPWFEFLLY